MTGIYYRKFSPKKKGKRKKNRFDNLMMKILSSQFTKQSLRGKLIF